jgi:hypothetical protein
MAQTIHLTEVPGILGVQAPSLQLESPDRTWQIKVPRAAFANMQIPEGGVLVSLTLTAVSLTDEPDEVPMGKLIVPKGAH